MGAIIHQEFRPTDRFRHFYSSVSAEGQAVCFWVREMSDRPGLSEPRPGGSGLLPYLATITAKVTRSSNVVASDRPLPPVAARKGVSAEVQAKSTNQSQRFCFSGFCKPVARRAKINGYSKSVPNGFAECLS